MSRSNFLNPTKNEWYGNKLQYKPAKEAVALSPQGIQKSECIGAKYYITLTRHYMFEYGEASLPFY